MLRINHKILYRPISQIKLVSLSNWLFICFVCLRRNIKWFVSADVHFTRCLTDGEREIEARFISVPCILTQGFEIDEQYQDTISIIEGRVQNFETQGSGWQVAYIKRASVGSAKYDSIGGGSHISLPPYIKNKKAIINIVNKDEKCFVYSVLAYLHPQPKQSNGNLPSKYIKFENELCLDGINFPVTIKQIPQFEVQNPLIGINVLYYDEDEKCVVPLYSTKHVQRVHQVNLFFITGIDKNGNKTTHYAHVKSLSKLLSDRSKHNGKCHVCMFCLHRYSKPESLESHVAECGKLVPCKITFPKKESNKNMKEDKQKAINGEEFENLEETLEIDKNLSKSDMEFIREKTKEYARADDEDLEQGNILRFKHYQRGFKCPFVIYIDFEAFISKDANDNDHLPSGFCALTISAYDHLNNHKAYVYSGENVMDNFYEHLQAESAKISSILEINVPMKPLTKQEKEEFEEAVLCYCCEETLWVKYKHHDHVTGKFIATVCNRCNLQLKYKKNKAHKSFLKYSSATSFIPVVCHNTKHYDSHLILKYLKKKYINSDIQVIASNTEQFMSFQIDNLRFLDSNQFLAGSLDALVETLKKDGMDKFVHTRRHFQDEKQFNLITRKGVYPYEYMDSKEKFTETQLPPIEAFYSKLNDSGISESSYEHANMVWSEFSVANMHEYHDLYLRSDVLLLCDVFENFRTFTLKNYKLDSAHYYTAPG